MNDQIVLAHETIHALPQDQAFDLEKLQESAKNDDQSLAIQALIEGDASLGGAVYMQENIPRCGARWRALRRRASWRVRRWRMRRITFAK